MLDHNDDSGEMEITSILPYFGAKRTMAPIIATELGLHQCYYEPFCGSLSVIMEKMKARTEVVNDLYGDLTNLARVIAHPKMGAALYRQMRRRLHCEDLLDEARQHLTLTRNPNEAQELGPKMDCHEMFVRAEAFFCAGWLGRAGEVGLEGEPSHNSFAVRYTNGGGDNATRLSSAVASIPAWRRRLRDVTITCRDGITALRDKRNSLDRDGTAIYVDPPYLVKSRRYAMDFSDEQHRELAEILVKYKRARIVVSYYQHPILESMYPPEKWDIKRYPQVKRLPSSSTGAGVAHEVLIVNKKAGSHASEAPGDREQDSGSEPKVQRRLDKRIKAARQEA
jgi:DNA adenine methylase